MSLPLDSHQTAVDPLTNLREVEQPQLNEIEAKRGAVARQNPLSAVGGSPTRLF